MRNTYCFSSELNLNLNQRIAKAVVMQET